VRERGRKKGRRKGKERRPRKRSGLKSSVNVTPHCLSEGLKMKKFICCCICGYHHASSSLVDVDGCVVDGGGDAKE